MVSTPTPTAPTTPAAPSTGGAFNNGVALSPTQVEQFRQQYKIQPAQQAQPASGGASDPWAAYDQAVGTKTTSTPAPAKSLGDSAAEEMTGGVDQIGRGIETAGQANANNDGSFGGTVKAVGQNLEGGLDAAAGVVRAGFAPFTALIKTLMPKGAIDESSGEEAGILRKPNDAEAGLYSWIQQHPEAAKNLQNVITVGGAALGGESGVLGDVGKTGVSDAATSVKNAAVDAVKTVKNVPSVIKDSSAARAAAKSQEALDSSTQAVMPHADKTQRMGDLTDIDKNIKREGVFGKSKPETTPEDVKRGTVAHEYIKGVKDPVEQRNALAQGIKDTSGKTNEFLDKNKTSANFVDMRSYLEANNKPSVSLAKDPVAEENYHRVTQQALSTLYKTMKSSAEESGDYGALTSGKDIRQARIEIDQQIKSELNENTFGTPQYKGIKAAAVDTRNLLNRMEEDLLRYPGQLEQLNKYNEDLAALKERGVSTNAKGDVTPEAQQALKDKHGLTSTPESESLAQQLSDYHGKMSNLYDSLYNVAEKYQTRLGNNKVQEFAKNHPVITNTIKAGARATGLGAGLHLVP